MHGYLIAFVNSLWVILSIWRPGGAALPACRRRGPTAPLASKPQNAAKDIHNPGAALLPVNSMRVVEIAGVKPPNSAVARQLIVLPSPIAPTHRELIIALAARHRLPAIYPFRYFPNTAAWRLTGSIPSM